MIKELIRELKTLDKYAWGQYTFKRDPIHNKVSSQEKDEMINKANECGRQEAIALRNKYGSKSILEYAQQLGIKVTELEDGDSKDYILFARFNSPNKISIYMKNIRKAEELVKNQNLNLLFDGVKIEDVLIAHEMFHFIEDNNKEIYTRAAKIMLWRLGPIKYHSGLVALGEIAAMAFAKELLQLSYYPNLFDILLLYPHDKSKAKTLYDEVRAMRGDKLNV
jgi:hypothetical protein